VTAEAAAPRFSEAALAEYQAICARYPTRRAALMPTLWLAQREFGYLPLPVQQYVADLMELPIAWVASVVSFYTMYWTERPARWHLQVCRNISCALRGGLEIRDALTARLGIRHGERTADGSFSLEEVECLASCGTAPCLQVNNGAYHENMTVESTLALVDRLAQS
jgi:NADH-quinone oxidoreductase E subunit